MFRNHPQILFKGLVPWVEQGNQPLVKVLVFIYMLLSRAHVIALRLYTTSAYKHINNPLRDQKRRSANRQHPLAATVICIQEGIKKLRNVVSFIEEERRSSGGIAKAETVRLFVVKIFSRAVQQP